MTRIKSAFCLCLSLFSRNWRYFVSMESVVRVTETKPLSMHSCSIAVDSNGLNGGKEVWFIEMQRKTQGNNTNSNEAIQNGRYR